MFFFKKIIFLLLFNQIFSQQKFCEVKNLLLLQDGSILLQKLCSKINILEKKSCSPGPGQKSARSIAAYWGGRFRNQMHFILILGGCLSGFGHRSYYIL